MADIERVTAHIPVSQELLSEAGWDLRGMITAALRGELPPPEPRPVPPVPSGHAALLAATDGPLREVVELHAPVWRAWWCCDGCDQGSHAEDDPDWPCRTVELIAERLGVDIREGERG